LQAWKSKRINEGASITRRFFWAEKENKVADFIMKYSFVNKLRTRVNMFCWHSDDAWTKNRHLNVIDNTLSEGCLKQSGLRVDV
jgi:hypothetical protein